MTQLRIATGIVTIEGALTRDTVVALREDLLVALALGEGCCGVRLSSVSSTDSAGVQLLSSLSKGFPELELCEPSESLRAALVRLGAVSLLGGAV